MSVFDLIILAILAALTLRGIWKGMVSQIVSVASYFVCWIVASRFGSLIAPTIPVEAPWNQVLAMAIIFLITLVAIRFASAALEKLIKDWRLQKLNTLLGGILGFAKGLLLCMIFTFFVVMFSETSRDVVFNSKTGIHLVKLITQIGVFVPEDSYEFVHAQLAQFQNKVDGTVPGRTPETLQVQSSEMIQQMLTQLQQAEMQPKTSTGSLWSALSKWWNGTKNQVPETSTETLSLTTQTDQTNAQSLLSAVPYTPPVTPPQPVHTYVAPQPAVSQTANVDDFFIRRAEQPYNPPAPEASMTALLPTTSEISALPSPALETLTPLTTLSALSALPELESKLLPTAGAQYHVGSDKLLRNSTQSTNVGNSAKVFRDQ